MKFLYNLEKILKNGFFLDFLFKNLILWLYKKIVGKNFLYIVDKYFTEYIFFFNKLFFNYLFNAVNTLKNLNFLQLTKFFLILIIQLILLFIL